MALFVGSGGVLLTSHRLVTLLGPGRSVHGPFGPSPDTHLTASLPLECISRLVLASDEQGSAPRQAMREVRWILVETVHATVLSLELHRIRTGQADPRHTRDRRTFQQFVTTTVDRLRAHPRPDTPPEVLDRAAGGLWDREGTDLVVTLTDRSLDDQLHAAPDP